VDKATGSTILVVDDYDSVRIALSLILKKSGFRVLAAESPNTARLLWNERRTEIDLLLVDISMPAISGPDLVRELLADGDSTPVIFVTGTGAESAREATQKIRNPNILQKPFAPDVLVKAVEDALARNAGAALSN
jgi:DNA-binding response OmpR family regulator